MMRRSLSDMGILHVAMQTVLIASVLGFAGIAGKHNRAEAQKEKVK